MKHKKWLALGAILLAQIISGIHTPIIHFAVKHISPFLYGFLRSFIAFLIIMPLALLRRRGLSARKREIKKKDILLALVAGVSIYSIANLFFYIGVQKTTSINASIISLLWPIFFFLANIEFLKERFSSRAFAGIGLAFAGTALAVLGPIAGTAGTAPNNMVGSIFIIVSVFADIAGTIIIKSILKRLHYLDVLAIGLGIASVVYLFIAAPYFGQLSALHDAGVRNAVLYGGIMVGCGTYCLNYIGLALTKGGEYGVVSYVQPITAMIVSVAFFGERFTPALMLGTVAVFSGLYLVEAHRVRHSHVHGVHR